MRRKCLRSSYPFLLVFTYKLVLMTHSSSSLLMESVVVKKKSQEAFIPLGNTQVSGSRWGAPNRLLSNAFKRLWQSSHPVPNGCKKAYAFIQEEQERRSRKFRPVSLTLAPAKLMDQFFSEAIGQSCEG